MMPFFTFSCGLETSPLCPVLFFKLLLKEDLKFPTQLCCSQAPLMRNPLLCTQVSLVSCKPWASAQAPSQCEPWPLMKACTPRTLPLSGWWPWLELRCGCRLASWSRVPACQPTWWASLTRRQRPSRPSSWPPSASSTSGQRREEASLSILKVSMIFVMLNVHVGK